MGGPPHTPGRTMKRAIFTADDFGLSVAVNEAVEQAHRHGILSTASLMVAAPAAADAVRRARAMPGLHVGLHVVAIEGPAIDPAAAFAIVGPDGALSADQVAASVGYAFSPRRRRQLTAEIHAQFAAFRATGLRLDHANAHKHMHLHPVVGRAILDAGLAFGLPALRIPYEPAAPLARSGTQAGLGAHALNLWTALLRRRTIRAGVQVNDAAFGIAWSGHMTAERVLRLIPNLPDGLNEIYFHPATHTDALLAQTMPAYEHAAELATLLDPALPAALAAAGVTPAAYGASAPPRFSPARQPGRG